MFVLHMKGTFTIGLNEERGVNVKILRNLRDDPVGVAFASLADDRG